MVGYQDPNDRPDNSVTIGFHYPTISYTQRYIDTTDSSDNHARTILAQTVSYTISDYVNQAQMAFTDSTNLAERDYTVLVTFWSTLISTLVLLPLTVAKIASMPAYSFKQAVALGLVTIPFGVASEIIEELYLDPYLEKWTQRMVLNLGGDQEAADFFSLLVTSFREAFIGGVSSAIKSRISKGGTDTDTQIATQQEVKLDKTSIRASLKKYIDFDTVSGILATIPSFFFGGAGVGIMLYGLDLGSDAIFNALKNRYNRKFSEGRLQLSEFLKPKPALKANEIAPFVTKNLVSVQTVASPSAAKSQLQVIQPQLQEEFTYNEQMKIRYESKRNEQKRLSTIQSLTLDKGISDVEIVAISEQLFAETSGDPVYTDENGVRHWVLPFLRYNPLTGAPYVRWTDQVGNPKKIIRGGLDLDGFIAMLGLKEGQIPMFKGDGEFPNVLLPGYEVEEIREDGTIVNTPLRGSMPIEQVFDLIGYNFRSKVALQQQYLGLSESIKIVTDPDFTSQTGVEDMVPIPDWFFNEYPGFVEIKDLIAPIFKNPTDLFNLNPAVVAQIEEVINQFVNPSVISFNLEKSEVVASMGGILTALESFIENTYMGAHNILNPSATIAQKDVATKLASKIFEEKYKKKFDYTTRTKGYTYVDDLFNQALKYSALVFFLEEVRAHFNVQTIGETDLASDIDSFLSTADIESLQREFVSDGLPRAMLKFAESFETAPNTRHMRFESRSVQIGWELQALSFLGILPYFLFMELIAKSYSIDFDKLTLYTYLVFNPYSTKNQDMVTDMEQILDGNTLQSIVDKINNDADLFGSNDNWREGDLISLLVEGIGFYNWEVKNANNVKSDYLLNIIYDLFSTIFGATSRSVALNDINIETQNEHWVVALDPDDPSSIFRVIKELTFIQEPSDIVSTYRGSRSREETRKYAKFIELYSKVSKLINEKISSNNKVTFMNELYNLFKDKSFNDQIKVYASQIFSASQADSMLQLVMDKFEVTKIPRWQQENLNLEQLITQDLNGFYQISYDNSFKVYVPTTTPIPLDLIQNVPYFVLLENDKYVVKEPSRLSQQEINRILSGNLLAVHNDRNENGILLAETPQLELPSGTADGYSYSVGGRLIKVFEGVFLSKNGFLNIGEVFIRHSNGQFIEIAVMPLETLAQILNQALSDPISISYTDPVTQEIVLGLPLLPGIQKYYTLDYLRSAKHEAGTKLTYLIQPVHSTIIPTDAHKKVVSSSTVLQRRKVMQDSLLKLPDSNPISTDDLFKGYIELSQIAKLTAGANTKVMPVFSILKDLQKLNQRLVIIGDEFIYDDNAARSDKDLEAIFTRLKKKVGFSQFNKLFYRDQDGNPYGKGQLSMKEFLQNFKDIVMSWEDPGVENRDEIDEIILDTQDLIMNLGSLNTANEEFSTSHAGSSLSELDRGLILLEAFQYLVGPFTMTLILLRSMWYFTSGGLYHAMPLGIHFQSVVDYIIDANIISSSQDSQDGYRQNKRYLPLTTVGAIQNHLPSYLYGNSFLYLPILGDNGADNAFYFGYAPSPFLSGGISVPAYLKRDFGINHINQYIGRAIGTSFLTSFNQYKIDNALTDPKINRVTLEMMAYEDIMSVIEQEVMSHFTSKYYSEVESESHYRKLVAKNLEDAYNTLMFARRDLTRSFTTDTSVDSLGGKIKDNLRLQLNRGFQDLTSSTIELYFYGCIVDGEIFKLTIDKEKFSDKFTRISRSHLDWSYYDTAFREQYNKRIIDERVDILKDLIESQPAGSRKVRIFITQNLGQSQDLSIDYGYQYITTTTSDQTWLPRSGEAFVDINLEDSSNPYGKISEITKLRYLVLLSLSFERELRADNTRPVSFSYQDFMFIIKKAGATIIDSNYIAYFNHKYIRSSSTILPNSNAFLSTYRGREFTQVVLTGPYTNLGRLPSRWVDISNFLPIRTTEIASFSYFQDFLRLNQ